MPSESKTEDGRLAIGDYVSVRNVGRPIGILHRIRWFAIQTEENGNDEPVEQALVRMYGGGEAWFYADQLDKQDPPMPIVGYTLTDAELMTRLEAERDELVRALRAQANAMCCLDTTIALLNRYKDVM